MMKKIFITGASGVLGTALQEELKDYELLCPTHEELDLTNCSKLQNYLRENNPDMTINCAAYTNVDKCETEIELSCETNIHIAGFLANWCKDNNKRFIQISSASIFGEFGALSPEINFYFHHPLNEYARQKLEAEYIIRDCDGDYKIIRSSWLFGNNTGQKKFIGQIYEKLKNGETIKAVTDIEGQLILSTDLAKFIRVVIEKWDDVPQILHAGSYDTVSRFEIAQYIEYAKAKNKNTLCSYTQVQPCLNREFNLKAQRPHKEFISVEKTEYVTGFKFRSWKKMIDDFILLMNK